MGKKQKQVQFGKPYATRLDIEVYLEDGVCGAYIADNAGGSGSVCEASTPEECGRQVGQYIESLFYPLD